MKADLIKISVAKICVMIGVLPWCDPWFDACCEINLREREF